MNVSTSYHSSYSNSWALIIGINKYKDASPLAYATNDANAVADILKKRFGFPKRNISLLLDEKATFKAIRKTFLGYTDSNKIKPDDRLLIFFAGHGHTVTGRRGEVGYLVPVDGRIKDLHTLMRWDDLTKDAELVPAKHIFFLMDACYGGLALQRSPAVGSMRFLGDMLQRYARQVLTAGKADETVADGKGVKPGHSIFTAHLLNAMEGAAETEESVITANTVMAYVYKQVAHDQSSHQTPHYGFVDGDGDFIFDTSLLDEIRGASGTHSPKQNGIEGKEGEKDILIHTSPQVATILNQESPVASSMKVLLPDPTMRIKLDDAVLQYVRHFLDATDSRHFPVLAAKVQKESKDEFVARLNKYEEISRDLQQVVILLAKWGDKEQLFLLEKIFTRLAEADKGSAGSLRWLEFAWYPLLVLMYSAGIAALATRKYDVLGIVFQTTVHAGPIYNKSPFPLVVPVIDNMTERGDDFKWIPGQEQRYVPRSEHLFKSLQPILEDLLFLGQSYESLFDTFEVLLALIYRDMTEKRWGPLGRFAWKYNLQNGGPFNAVVSEAKKERENWGPLCAGLFHGSLDRFLEDAAAYEELVAGLHWR